MLAIKGESFGYASLGSSASATGSCPGFLRLQISTTFSTYFLISRSAGCFIICGFTVSSKSIYRYDFILVYPSPALLATVPERMICPRMYSFS